MEEDEFIKACKVAMETGTFDMNGALGGRFYRDMKRGTINHAEYSELKGRTAKALFRQNWAKKTLGSIVEEKEEKTSYKRIDKNKGVYRPFGAIVNKEGGWSDPVAVRGTKLLAIKCIKMGGHWISTNPFTERMEYLHLKKGFESEYGKSWAMLKRSSSREGIGPKS